MNKRSPIALASLIFGVVFLAVGVLGFVPGITPGDLQLTSGNGDSNFLGLFEVSVLHNIVHLLLGVIGIAASRATKTSHDYLLKGGIAYLAVTAVTYFLTDASIGLVALLVGVVMIGANYGLDRKPAGVASKTA